jgi:hypothetical protein
MTFTSKTSAKKIAAGTETPKSPPLDEKMIKATGELSDDSAFDLILLNPLDGDNRRISRRIVRDSLGYLLASGSSSK